MEKNGGIMILSFICLAFLFRESEKKIVKQNRLREGTLKENPLEASGPSTADAARREPLVRLPTLEDGHLTPESDMRWAIQNPGSNDSRKDRI